MTMDYEKPYKVKLEFCSLCQLNCKTCYRRRDNSGTVGKGYLTYENFVKFVEMNPFVTQIETSDNGEIFLNRNLLKIVW